MRWGTASVLPILSIRVTGCTIAGRLSATAEIGSLLISNE